MKKKIKSLAIAAAVTAVAVIPVLADVAGMITTTTTTTEQVAITTDPAVIYGDLTGEGNITLLDAQVALKIALRMKTDATAEEIKAGDVMNVGDGITLADAQAILKRALRIQVVFDVER